MLVNTYNLVPAVLAGFLATVHGQNPVPTATTLWYPQGIPDGPVPTSLDASLLTNPEIWNLRVRYPDPVSNNVTTNNTSRSGYGGYWTRLSLTYEDQSKTLKMRQTNAHFFGIENRTGTQTTMTRYVYFLNGTCISSGSADRAECTGSYGSYTQIDVEFNNQTDVSTLLLRANATDFPTAPAITALSVRITQAPSGWPTSSATGSPAPTTSSSTGGAPKATQHAGALVGAAAALAGGVMMLV